MTKQAILVDLNRCTGCWTCSMACKMAYHLDVDEYRISVRTIGGNRIDEPTGIWPDLHLSWMPIFKKECTMCGDRRREGKLPFCEMCCPSGALFFGDVDDSNSALSQKREELLRRGYGETELPSWEYSWQPVLYLKKDY